MVFLNVLIANNVILTIILHSGLGHTAGLEILEAGILVFSLALNQFRTSYMPKAEGNVKQKQPKLIQVFQYNLHSKSNSNFATF